MHAIGARLPAARCLWAQTHAHHHALASARALAPRYDAPRLCRRAGDRLSLSARTPIQTRFASSKAPGGSDTPDKPLEANEQDEAKEGKEKDEHAAAQPSASIEPAESLAETKRQPLFPQPGGRGRSSNHGSSSSGLPPFTLPTWFLDEHVHICDAGDAAAGEEAWDGVWRQMDSAQAKATPVQQDNGGTSAAAEPGQQGDSTASGSLDRAMGRELVSTISAELNATAPPTRATKEPKRRPISLLYVHNYKGNRVANAIMDRVGAQLGADVVHLDATRLARIVAPYFGSTLYFGRGKMSMLGYAAAEANGRAAAAPSMAEEGDEDIVLRGAGVLKFLQQPDERVTWDDLKLAQVSKVLANAAAAKREASGVAEPGKADRVILHLHNYVELTMTPEGAAFINKLRTTVDRLWQSGTKIVIVGSASNDADASARWHAKVRELSSQDCYPIVFSPQADPLPEVKLWERQDYLRDNLSNISWMLECLQAEPISVVLPSSKDAIPASSEAVAKLIEKLSNGICSNHWIYRLVTQAIGFQRYQDGPLDIPTLAEALRRMQKVDEARLSILGLQNPSTPEAATASSSPASSPLETLISLGDMAGAESKPGGSKNPKNLNLDEEEKKLLPGIVNVADIHTTFDDVIAPADVRDSLVSLTTLSLQHPKAFSYGVLARERIHGALLYGPPGTGKTLMAKALAKSSGANMLEISAASINDMWVGNSEKNVRAVFSLARKMSPMVVFLDEADSLLGSRARQPNRGGYRETINQFLREWDGLTHSINTQQIFILVSTNRPQDMDEAVLRRLPRRILVDLPLKEGRLAILQSLLRDEVLDAPVSLEKLAADTELYSGSDLKNLAVAAAMEAAKEELAAKKSHDAASSAANNNNNNNSNSAAAAPYEFPARRVLLQRHFDKAARDITASISEDMQSLKALRKFDEQYGDARRKKRKSHMGFEVVPRVVSSEEARIRNN